MAGARASIIHENLLLADDAVMAGMLEDMVLESKQNAYDQELKKAIHGLQVPVPWQFIPRVQPEDLETEEGTKRSDSSCLLDRRETGRKCRKIE